MSDTPSNQSMERRGRPGKYPGSPQTVRIRVPKGTEDFVHWAITELNPLVSDYNQASRPTRDWTAFHRMMDAIRLSQKRYLQTLRDNGEITDALLACHRHGGIVFLTEPAEKVDTSPG